MANAGKIEPEHIQMGQLAMRLIAQTGEPDGRSDVFEMVVPAGARVPPKHAHDHTDELLVGVAGVLTYTVGDETFEIRAGDSVLAPRGVPHAFANLHAETARTLSVFTPGNIAPHYFRDMAKLFAAGGPPDPQAALAVMARHGLQVVR